MNRGHAVGCPALRAGVPCVCWEIQDQAGRIREIDELYLKAQRGWEYSLNRAEELEGRVRALDIEWHGLQAMADEQRKALELGHLEATDDGLWLHIKAPSGRSVAKLIDSNPSIYHKDSLIGRTLREVWEWMRR